VPIPVAGNFLSQTARAPRARFASAKISSLGGALVLLTALLALTTIPAVGAQVSQQPSPLDELADKASAAIAKQHDSKHADVKKKILVVNFSEKDRKPSELGGKLADEFADSMRKQAPNFVVINRDDYWGAAALDRLPAEILPEEGVSKCYGAQLGADYNAVGSLEYTPGKVIVGISLIRNENHKKIFDETASLPITAEIQALLARPAAAVVVSSSPSSDNPSSADPYRSLGIDAPVGVPFGGTRGYTMPTCLHCPVARYSDAALATKFQGTVLAGVRVGPNGSVESVAILHGLPCGLNQAAIDALKQWNLKPADGQDGKPAAVVITIEVKFSLY
jgi:TonB family protein